MDKAEFEAAVIEAFRDLGVTLTEVSPRLARWVVYRVYEVLRKEHGLPPNDLCFGCGLPMTHGVAEYYGQYWHCESCKLLHVRRIEVYGEVPDVSDPQKYLADKREAERAARAKDPFYDV